MTEEEWCETNDVNELVGSICQDLRPISHRKLRLFGCACCRAVWKSMRDSRARRIVKLSEQFADGDVSNQQFIKARRLAVKAINREVTRNRTPAEEHAAHAAFALGLSRTSFAPTVVAENCANAALCDGSSGEVIIAAQCKMLRDIFGNPYRPVTIDPRWRTSDVVGLAQATYDDKAFERMPILADALMDAGCEDEQIIGHCRGDGPHVVAAGWWISYSESSESRFDIC
jgi:hypothetical protein